MGVAVELLELVVDVVVEGEGQFAINGAGALAPGQGLSWPKIWPSIGPKPSLRGPMFVKSFGGGVPPGVTSSGKIHSVTGWTYCPASMSSVVVTTLSPILTR